MFFMEKPIQELCIVLFGYWTAIKQSWLVLNQTITKVRIDYEIHLFKSLVVYLFLSTVLVTFRWLFSRFISQLAYAYR